MYKLDLKKVEEPEIKLSTSVGSLKKQRGKKKNKQTNNKTMFASLTMLKPLTLTAWITVNCGKFLEIGIPDYLTCPLRNL